MKNQTLKNSKKRSTIIMSLSSATSTFESITFRMIEKYDVKKMAESKKYRKKEKTKKRKERKSRMKRNDKASKNGWASMLTGGNENGNGKASGTSIRIPFENALSIWHSLHSQQKTTFP